jgi:hypothetical protein
MKTKIYINAMLFLCSLFLITSCKKDFLDKKPATNLDVPTSLNDLQLLLDNTISIHESPSLGEVSSDDYYMTYNSWYNEFAPYFSNSYVWAKEIFAGKGNISDWDMPYTQVLYTNVVLQQLNGISRNGSNSATYDNIKGSALFMRSWMFFDLAQVYVLPYDSVTFNTELGIPLRLTADINAPTIRPTIKQTYEQILSDVIQARILLTNNTSPIYQNRPSKAAVFGFLSRVYLTMRNYSKAGLYADSALQLQNTLIDYNTVDATARLPFNSTNSETVYQNLLISADPTSYLKSSQGYSIDTLLYQSYNINDLRKVVYFAKNGIYINKKRGYSGQSLFSNGIITDELYLTRAECFARANNTSRALGDLNTLLVTRWKTGTYIPKANLQGTALLDTILKERRKELVLRGLRWNDIRRLNKEGYNITLTRNLNGTTYTLPPNDRRYALPIPPDVITLSGIQQNDR